MEAKTSHECIPRLVARSHTTACRLLTFSVFSSRNIPHALATRSAVLKTLRQNLTDDPPNDLSSADKVTLRDWTRGLPPLGRGIVLLSAR